jgi:hypothetical protein
LSSFEAYKTTWGLHRSGAERGKMLYKLAASLPCT